jgi:hypothetical protein
MATVIYESRSYTVHADYAGGYVLLRRDDGATHYFEPGDDAKQFWSDLKGAEEHDNPWIVQDRVDHLLSRYDDILKLEG